MGWYVSWGDLLVPQLYFKHPPSWTVGLNWDSILYSVFVAWVYSCTYIWQLFIIFVKFYILANYVTSTSQSCLAVRLKANSGSVKSSRINFSLYSWPKMHQHYSGIHTCQGASGDCQNFSVHFSGHSNNFSECLDLDLSDLGRDCSEKKSGKSLVFCQTPLGPPPHPGLAF